MPQLFKRRANAIARGVSIAVPLLVIAGWGAFFAFARSDFWTQVDSPLEQPVPFSHQHHVGGLGIDCRYCHTSVEQSAFAGLPSTVLGGGNAKRFDTLPKGVEAGHNRNAYLGGVRLWEKNPGTRHSKWRIIG